MKRALPYLAAALALVGLFLALRGGGGDSPEFKEWQARKAEREQQARKLDDERARLLEENAVLKKQIGDVAAERDALNVVVESGNARVKAADAVIEQAQKEFVDEEARTRIPVDAATRRERMCAKLAKLNPPIPCGD